LLQRARKIDLEHAKFLTSGESPVF